MGFLYWKSDAAKGGLKEEGHIDLLQVHEILKGFRVAKVAEESNFINRPKNSCLSIYHGSAFNLNVLILYATSDKVADDWIEGLRLRGSKICIQGGNYNTSQVALFNTQHPVISARHRPL